MRTIWRILVRTIFWSFERGTWPYDIAVVLIVVFVLFSPRSWFKDRPSDTPRVAQMLRVTGSDSPGATETYRVDARTLDSSVSGSESELERDLREAVRRNAKDLARDNFQIVGIEPVRSKSGTVEYYDVSIKP